MTGQSGSSAPLRPGDPRRLGPYDLLGRLGQGGMGTVYLARGSDGAHVAVKMVRADLAPDEEFRRRFRSEVNRARQVPPFCTAEVLDADPDHEHPYLVVEYVDGPTLADVVEERGPLTASNLHSVAIGVATALTAIHGAGVIHRDLKPRNVLLAPGSPKVIDFGIARALEPTSNHTGTDQMVGTVAYMAPERFGPEPGRNLTPAADIFAWGAVVAYAGTGRTPFHADSAPATAARILTQPPDLSGMSGRLRSLVAHSLEKDPTNRPSARELLDLLLATGAQRSAATAEALAHQPGLQEAAREAQAATDQAADRQLTAVAAPAALGALPSDVEAPAASGPLPTDVEAAASGIQTVGLDEALRAQAATAALRTQEIPAQRRSSTRFGLAAMPRTRPADHDRADIRSRWSVVVALLAVVLIGALTLVGVYHLSRRGDSSPGGPGGAGRSGPVVGSSGGQLLADKLTGPRLWQQRVDAKAGASCSFDGALVVRLDSAGSYRCPGPEDRQSADQRLEVDVRLLREGSCASIWFRFGDERGYQAKVCETAVLIGTNRRNQSETLKTLPFEGRPIPVNGPAAKIAITVEDDRVDVARDGVALGGVALTDADLRGARMVLGIATERQDPPHSPPYAVAFADVSIWTLDS